MDIREASSGDIPLLAALIRDSFRDVAVRFALTPENCPAHPSCCDEEWVEAAMGKSIRFFLLEEDGHPCGCVAMEKAGPDVCYLERLAVLPSQRHKGHGKSLVGHVLEEARGAGVERVDIGIIAAQTELRDWYLGLGFAETEKKRFEHLPFEVAFMSYGI